MRSTRRPDLPLAVRLLRALFSWLARGEAAALTIADLDEEFMDRVAGPGTERSAAHWYRRQLFMSFIPAIRDARYERLRLASRFGIGPSVEGKVFRTMDVLMKDLRFALRAMFRNRTTSAVAIVTFGLGIAACTAMFSVVNTVLLRPLPYPEPDRIVNVYQTNPDWIGVPGFDEAAERGSFSYLEMEEMWREDEGTLEGLAMTYTAGATVRSPDGPPQRIVYGATTAELLGPVLRVMPVMGRLFVPDDLIDDPNVIVLGEEFWDARFGRDPDVLGRTIDISNRLRTIVGVVPAGTRMDNAVPDAWGLLEPWENRGDHRTHAVARLAEGVSPEQAAAELSRISLASAPPDEGHAGINVMPRQSETTRDVRGALMLLAGGAGLLLLIACANVAALLVGRMLDREGELAIRDALGASRVRLLRQIVTESTVLAGVGAILGVLLSGVALRGLALIAPEGVPRIDEVAIDARVLAMCVVLALFAGVASGVLPGLAVRAIGRRAGLARSRRTLAGRSRLQSAVVVAEIAMATVLLVSGGLLARTVSALGSADAGFAIRDLVSFNVSLPPLPVADAEGDAGVVSDRLGDLAREIATIPGVEGVALTSVLPLTPTRGNNGLLPEGYDREDPIIAERRFVSAGFFDVAGIRLVEGRGFEPGDDVADAPGRMVISRSLARYLWPNESAIGRRITYWGNRETTVVGVVADQRDENLREATAWAFYVPRVQAGQLGGAFLVRATGPTRMIPAIRDRVQSVQPAAAIIALQPMSDLIESEIAQEVYRARLAGLFAILATVFSILGIYGVTTRAVTTRTREIGIRKALGGEDRAIMGKVYAEAARLALIGGVVGLVAALLVSRWIERMLWGVETTDPLTMVAVAGTLALGSLVASWGPGRRVRRLDPIEALRAE